MILEHQRRYWDLATVVFLALFLVAPLLAALTREPLGKMLVNERRPVEQAPELRADWNSIAEFPEQFERHFSDTVGLRTAYLHLRARLMWFVFGVSPTPVLLRGRDGWVFMTSSHSLEVYRGMKPLSEVELAEWCLKLEERQAVLEAMGVKYLFAIAPNKNQVYADYLPPQLAQVGPTRLDQLVGYLEQHSDFRILDLRETLRAERKRDEGQRLTYYPLGTHWTNRGAFAAHVAITTAMGELLAPGFPSLAHFPAAHCRRAPQDKQADTWADRMYLEDVLFQEVYSHNPDRRHMRSSTVDGESVGDRDLVTTTGDGGLPTTVMFHDSFGMQLRPFMAEVTKKMTSYRDTEFTPSLGAVREADLVLDLWVERILVTQSAGQPCSWDQAGLGRLFQASRLVNYELSPAEAQAFSDFRQLRVSVATEDAAEETAAGPIGRGDLILGGLVGSRSQTYIVAVDLECQTPGRLAMAWRTRRDPGFSGRNKTITQLAAGRNTAFFHLHAPDLEGDLRLRFSPAPGKYTLYRLEIRAINR